jgi:hypothetical protein
MAKKKQKKKHNFQHKGVVAPSAKASASQTAVSAAPAQAQSNEWLAVRGDVRRSLWLSAIFIGLMIGLYIVLNNTNLGETIYKSIVI